MNGYKVIYQIKSPVITPFQADTIFGHLCWAIKYIKGEESLIDFLKIYDHEKPPLILSDGFPEGFLPMPILRPLTIDEEDTKLINIYFGADKKNKIKGLTFLKRLKAQPFISTAILNELEGSLSYFRLYEKVLEGKYCPSWFRKRACSEKEVKNCPLINPESSSVCNYLKKCKEDNLVFHNTINRVTGRVEEPGGLFTEIETYYPKEEANYEIYLQTTYFSLEEIQKYFSFIGENGYGKDKSIGKGYLELKDIQQYTLFEPQDSNGFMTLSSFIPAEDDPIEGFYEVFTKYGKLGGDYAKSGIGGEGLNPFKKPLLMFKAGSTFLINHKSKNYYGRLVSHIHSSPQIRQYGYAFPLKIKLE
ncbi:MAG TPA: hypothetical protein ENG48_04085 [Candidatus Atribacteria bacterium]|nr:hypothetical protein [Candidatus Atribacteria bacterium]